MFGGTRNQTDPEVVPLCNAVFCLDCEAISNTPRDECPSCMGRSLVSLSRMLGGSLAHQIRSLKGCASMLFDITITVGLEQMHAEDLNTALERLSNMVGSKLGRAKASVHIDVQPYTDTLRTQPALEPTSPTPESRGSLHDKRIA